MESCQAGAIKTVPQIADESPVAPVPRVRLIWEDFSMRSGQAAATVQDWIEKLHDAHQVVRIHAGSVLGELGAEAKQAVPALIDLLQHGDVQDARLAALTLGEIGTAAAEAIPALMKAADDDDAGVANMALWALEQVDLVDRYAAAA